MGQQETPELEPYFEKKLKEARIHFERALACKHTEFDNLYPYMHEHPQFFWYKRYVAWQELLTIVQMASELGVEWRTHFTEQQTVFIENKVLESKVLDNWFEQDKQKEETR